MFKTEYSKRNATFRKGAGVFKCNNCTRSTRGDCDSADLKLCAECYAIGGLYNRYLDCGSSMAPATLLALAQEMAALRESAINCGGDGFRFDEVQEVVDAAAKAMQPATPTFTLTAELNDGSSLAIKFKSVDRARAAGVLLIEDGIASDFMVW